MPKRVVVVDDAPDVRRILRAALEREGYQIVEAETAADALRVLATDVPDLLISDIMMPDMDGFDLLTQVRADPRLLGLPVILITAAANAGVEDRARDLGVEHFVKKPVDINQLRRTVRGTIERFAQLRRAGVVASAAPVAAPGDAQPSGIEPLDALIGGVVPGRSYYVTGDLGTGKSAFCVQVVHHVLARGERAVLVTTERPAVVLRQAKTLGLDLQPFVQADALVLLEPASDVDRLLDGPDDLRALAKELAGHVREAGATRLAVSSVLTLLAASPRLTLTATVAGGFLRDLEENGVTTFLFGEPPVTPEEQLADAFIRRSAFGSVRLARTPGPKETRVLLVERHVGPHGDGAERPYAIVPGRGLVSFDPDAEPPPDDVPPLVRFGEVLDAAARGDQPLLAKDRDGGVRLRDAWALAFQDAIADALRTNERCALMVAKVDPAPAGSSEALAEAVSSLWGPNRIARWIGGTDLVVLALGDDAAGIGALAERFRERVERVAAERCADGVSVAAGVAAFSAHARPGETVLEVLRRLAPRGIAASPGPKG